MTADIRRFEEIDSTNEEARRLGDQSAEGPVWIVAARQTAGRGRRGRAWESPSGNFMGTLYLTPRCGPREAGELSFVAALAVHEAVASLLPPTLRPELRHKWPNDLLHDRAKLAGILLESSGVAGAEVAWVAIGMGVNLATHPEGLEYKATSLAALGVSGVTPDDALTALDKAFEHWLGVWRGQQGFAAIREAWLKRAEGIGGPIVVRLSSGALEGIFESLAPDGALQLRLADGTLQLVSAGDVFFGPPAPGPAR
ncbi:MAG: biotin--[acetyl-CoA-carboxylase] ligase [Nitratireductor sp.]